MASEVADAVKLLRSEVSPLAKCYPANFTSLGIAKLHWLLPTSLLRSKNFTLLKTTTKTTALLTLKNFFGGICGKIRYKFEVL